MICACLAAHPRLKRSPCKWASTAETPGKRQSSQLSLNRGLTVVTCQDVLHDQRTTTPSRSQPEAGDAAARLAPFKPQAQPGFRLPHCPLQPITAEPQQSSTAEVSSLDLGASGWVLIGSGGAWAGSWLASSVRAWEAAPVLRRAWIAAEGSEGSNSHGPSDICAALFQDTSGSWTRVMGGGSGLVLLVRPDGHVAARIDAGLGPCAGLSTAQQVRVLQGVRRMLLPQPSGMQ